ncbi:hypothetical protein QVD17_04469 [Tagetes erecta]|uniref:Uncharacterized protein n=1 Tax=Tagetes erecta TaxID=13708 RepID=A0AAD8P4G3_TARER|nr:hypothetical protein QVD17_04469 [Tagetes erecta]
MDHDKGRRDTQSACSLILYKYRQHVTLRSTQLNSTQLNSPVKYSPASNYNRQRQFEILHLSPDLLITGVIN